MRARLLAVVPLLMGLTACDVVGPGGSFGGGGSDYPNYSLFGSIGFQRQDPPARMQVGESRLFVVRISDKDFAKVVWSIGPNADGAAAELLGFVCHHVNSCAIEDVAVTPDGPRATLRVYDTRELTARVLALRPGVVKMTIRGEAAPCAATYALSPPKCGQSYSDSLSFVIDR